MWTIVASTDILKCSKNPYPTMTLWIKLKIIVNFITSNSSESFDFIKSIILDENIYSL